MKAYEIISDPEFYLIDVPARDVHGRQVRPDSGAATHFSMIGALIKAYTYHILIDDRFYELENDIGDINRFMSKKSHEEAVKVLALHNL